MVAFHGSVGFRKADPHPAYDRYVAVLDVLGMKAWLEAEDPQKIAETLDVALVACDQSSSGQLNNGKQYGPIIGTTHFSDTLLAWSPDSSWASFSTICFAVKMITAVALKMGVPLRGSISSGKVVCGVQKQRFVGRAIADAFQWSDENRPYRSVGIDITPNTVSLLTKKLISDPIPPCWDNMLHGTPQAVITRQVEASNDLVWYRDCLFLNHWSHGLFTGSDPGVMFGLRGLPVSGDVQKKMAEMVDFFTSSKKSTSNLYASINLNGIIEDNIHCLDMQLSEYYNLDRIRLNRAPF